MIPPDSVRPVEVVGAYTSQYQEPIRFGAGERIEVEREDTEYPGWFWCRVVCGREGWVHQSFLAARAGTTVSVRAYSAKELTVAGGERGRLLDLLDGWAYLRLDGGREGWLPQNHIQPAVD